MALSSSLVSGFRFLAGAVLNGVSAFQALNTAMKVTVIGAALAAITALYFAYDSYTNSLTAAEAAQKSVNDVTKAAISSTEVERAKISNLVAVLDDNTQSLDNKKSALDQLKAISPSYFGNLDIEKGKVVGLTQAVDAYVRSLERSAIVKQATDELAKQSDILRNIGEQGDPTILQQTGNAIQALATNLALGGIAGGSFKSTFDDLNKSTQTFNQIDLQESTKAKIESLRALIKENIDLGNETAKTTDNTRKYGGAVAETSAKAKILKEVLSDVSNATETARLLGEDEDIAKIEELQKGIKKLIDAGFKPASAEVQNLKAQLDALTAKPTPVVIDIIPNVRPIGPVSSENPDNPLPNAPKPTGEGEKSEAQKVADKIKEIQDGLISGNVAFAESFAAAQEVVTANGSLMQNVFLGMGDAISSAASEGASSFAKLGLAAAGAAAKIVRAYIQQGVAAAVAKALQGIPFPFNLAAAAAAGGIAAALFTNLIGKVGVKGFAAGTRDAPGGLALVGERGPELVNLPRHSQVFNAGVTSTALRGGQNLNITGEFVARGTEMVLVIDRTRAKENRFK